MKTFFVKVKIYFWTDFEISFVLSKNLSTLDLDDTGPLVRIEDLGLPLERIQLEELQSSWNLNLLLFGKKEDSKGDSSLSETDLDL